MIGNGPLIDIDPSLILYASSSLSPCIQIGDFGLARDLAYDSYYLSSGGLVPVRWTAPEVMHSTMSQCVHSWSSVATPAHFSHVCTGHT